MIPVFRQGIFLDSAMKYSSVFGHFQFDTLADHGSGPSTPALQIELGFNRTCSDSIFQNHEQGGSANFVHLVVGKTQGTKGAAIQLMAASQSDGQGRRGLNDRKGRIS